VGPTENRKVPKLRTFTSSRTTAAAVASNRSFCSEFTPKYFWQSEISTDCQADINPEGPISLDCTPFLPPAAELASRVGRESFDLRYVLLGAKKGIDKIVCQSGHILTRDTRTRFTCSIGGEYGRLNLTIAPAFAPTIGLITDETALKAERYISQAFTELPDKMANIPRTCTRMGEILSHGVNPTRFIYRLAALYIHSSFAAPFTGQRAFVQMRDEPPRTLDSGSMLTWQRAVNWPDELVNYVPWVPGRFDVSPRDVQYYSILAMAACNQVVIGQNSDSLDSPIFWPHIENVVLMGSFKRVDFVKEMMYLDPVFVHEVAYAWCNRYASVETLNEAIQIVGMMYWSNSQSCIAHSPDADLPLPPANMTGYIMGPLLADVDKYKPLILEDYQRDGIKTIAECAVMAYIFWWVRTWCRDVLIGGAIETGVWDDFHHLCQGLRPLCPDGIFEIPVISFSIQQFLSEIGVAGKLGRFLGRMASVTHPEAFAKWYPTSISHSPTALDVVALGVAVPLDSAARAVLNPVPFKKTCDLELLTMLEEADELNDWCDLRCGLMNLVGVDYVAFRFSRNSKAITEVGYGEIRRNARGQIRDNQLLPYTCSNGDQIGYAFRLNTLEQQQIVCAADHDRYHLTWYKQRVPNAQEVNRFRGFLYPKGEPAGAVPTNNPSTRRGPSRLRTNFSPPPTTRASNTQLPPARQSQSFLPEVPAEQDLSANYSDNERAYLSIPIKPACRSILPGVEAAPPAIKNALLRLVNLLQGEHPEMFVNNLVSTVEQGLIHTSRSGMSVEAVPIGMMPDFTLYMGWQYDTIINALPKHRHFIMKDICCVLHWLLGLTFDHRSNMIVRKFYDACLALGTHLLHNPSLTVAKYFELGAGGSLSATEAYANKHEVTPRNVMSWVLNACHPTMVDGGQPVDVIRKWFAPARASATLVQLMRLAEEYLLDPTDIPCLAHIRQTHRLEYSRLDSVEAEALIQYAEYIDRLCDTSVRRISPEDLEGFQPNIPRPDRDSDEDGPPDGSKTIGGAVQVLGNLRRQTRKEREGTNTKKQSGQHSNSQAGSTAHQNSVFLHTRRWQNAEAAAFTTRTLVGYCPCELTSAYGGKWHQVTKMDECKPELLTFAFLRRWWDSLDEVSQAAFMVTEHYGCAGVEHFQALFDSNLPTVGELPQFSVQLYRERRKLIASDVAQGLDISGDLGIDYAIQLVTKWYASDSVYKSDFAPFALHGGMPVVMTAKIVKRAFPQAGPLIEVLHNLSPDALEYEVATTVIALLCLPLPLLLEVLCMDWFSIALDSWHKTFKGVVTRSRRSLIFGTTRGDCVLALRKIFNTTIRRIQEPDLSVEIRNRSHSVTPKTWVGFHSSVVATKGLISPRDLYIKHYIQVSRDFTRKLVQQVGSRGTILTVNEWWAERAINSAAGASTLLKMVDRNSLDLNFSQNDRPGKKVTVELLPNDAVEYILRQEPSNRASFFVKPEPGLKSRALYSTFDEETFVASYASQGQENSMFVLPGVKVRQTPHDVVEWMVEAENVNCAGWAPKPYWLSVDYSDYNAEHTIPEMAIQEAAFAEAWDNLTPVGGSGCKQKAAACVWKARSYYNSWVCWGNRDVTGWATVRIHEDPPETSRYSNGIALSEILTPEQVAEDVARGKRRKRKVWTRIINGLYSGHRDTARQNTLIHAIDVEIAKKQLNAIGVGHLNTYVALCGDDEDIKFDHPMAAMLYYGTLGPGGHQLNPTKQLGGEFTHEFLQMIASRTTRVEKPLNTILATLGSGNWYQQLGLWVQSAIESCISNWWECYCRGMKLGLAQRLCSAYLDHLMRIPPDRCTGTIWETTGKELEWWVYRNQPSYPPLFAGTEGPNERIPRFEAMPEPHSTWPRQATDAYIETQRALLMQLPQRYASEFRDLITSDTVGSALKTSRQAEGKRWAARHWPERKSCVVSGDLVSHRVNQTRPTELWKTFLSTPRQHRILDEATVFSRMGVNMFLARKLGGLRGLFGKLPPTQWSRCANVEKDSYELNNEGTELQLNVRAVLTHWRAPHPKYHGAKISLKAQGFIYVFMANGSGKTHFTRIHRGADDLDEIWTDLYGAAREAFDIARPASSFSNVAKVAREIVERSMQNQGILLGQLNPDLVNRAVRELSLPNQLFYHDPGEGLRRERLVRRKWAPDKIERRLERARQLYCSCQKLGWTKLESLDQLAAVITAAEKTRRTALHQEGCHPKQRTEFIFDRTEAVTRRLKIIEESEQEHGFIIH